jgi:hypothetical protein
MPDYYGNPELRVSGLGRQRLEMALSLALGNDRPTSYVLDPTAGLILRSGGSGGTAIPDFLKISDLVWSWLQKAQKDETLYANEPYDFVDRGDTINEPGWLIYVEFWGFVADDRDAICGIKPYWCWIGK